MNVAGRRHVAVERPSGNRQVWLFFGQRRIGTMRRLEWTEQIGVSGRVLNYLAKCSSEASYPSKSVRRASHNDNVKSLIISLLLVVRSSLSER